MCQNPDNVAPEMRTSPFQPLSFQDVLCIILNLITCLRLPALFSRVNVH